MVVYCVYSLYVSFVSLYYACPSLKSPVGLFYMDTWSAEGLGFLRNSSSHFPGLCSLVLTCSHDSLFLGYPAIDIVWRGPVSVALGFVRPLALRGSAWWSPNPGWCSIQSFSRTSVLPFLTLTHTLTVAIFLRWYRLWRKTPMVSLFLCCVCVPSVSTPLLLHIPPSGSMIEIVLIDPLPPGEGEISLPHSQAIFSKLKNEDRDLFSFRNCKKWWKKAQNAIISLSFPSYMNWQPPENRQCIGERARREVAKRKFGSPQAVVYEWIRLIIVLLYADHLFSMTQTLLPRFCSNKEREMVMCL